MKTDIEKSLDDYFRSVSRSEIETDVSYINSLGSLGVSYDDYLQNLNTMKTEITKESLEKYGMKLTQDPVVPMLKEIGNGSAGRLSIGVSRYRNADEITLSFPEGMFYLNVECIEDLEKFESMIQSYEPNF